MKGVSLFSNVPSLISQGYYFIDRDGKYFEPILEFLRTGEITISPLLSKDNVAREASFYNIHIPDLVPKSGSHSPTASPR
jgi:hypothetical protein